MIIIRSEEIAKPICDSMGLDASKIERLVIDLRAGEVAMIKVDYFAGLEDQEKLTDRLKKYSLVEIKT